MYYIFNQQGDFVASCNLEPDSADLMSRNETVVQSEDIFDNPVLINGIIVEQSPRPSSYHKLQNGIWVISDEHQVQLKAEQQTQVWEQIKQKRHDNLRGGCYVKSVDKWFHTNDESRQQYIFMRTLDQLPPIQWKTMDNSFVTLTKALLDELSMQMLLNEQADFTNAERHKALMEQADTPLDYDFSTGWSAVYQGD
ncbi:DUF4376 domain-containing protein [Pasteurellaceae bacterium 22721_9_1]